MHLRLYVSFKEYLIVCFCFLFLIASAKQTALISYLLFYQTSQLLLLASLLIGFVFLKKFKQLLKWLFASIYAFIEKYEMQKNCVFV